MGIPAYTVWSARKLEVGESPAFIARLDTMSMWLLPEEVAEVGESEFEELLADVKEVVSKCELPSRLKWREMAFALAGSG